MPRPLARWDPFAELSEPRTRFDRAFDAVADGIERRWMPAIDVMREDGNLIVRADIPGIKADEVKIEFEDDILTISGQHVQHTDEQHERRCASYSRSITLPADADAKKIGGTTHDGVVEVTIPSPRSPRRRRSRSPRPRADPPSVDVLGRVPVSSGDQPAA